MGFDWIITTDSIFWKRWTDTNGNVPIWEMGYDCINGPVYTKNSSCVNYSGFPVHNLDRPAMWHSPDKYLIHVNAYNHVYPYGQEIIDKLIVSTAGGALHEYGHYFGLFHPPINQFDQCSLNIMQPGGGSEWTAFSGCQVRTMYETLMTKNLRKYVICEDKLDFSLIIATDETWRINTRIFGDIIIKDSASLTITCEVAMDPESRIIVKRGGQLIVDGGLITSDCEEKWNGIIVEGDVPGKQAHSGKVILKNDAVIELAKTAISMLPAHIPWNYGEQQEFYAGIIEAEYSTIRNCDRGIAFMKYDSAGYKDKSWFNDVTFENLIYGMTLWADDGVTMDSCTFINITKSGVYAYDSEVIVRENNSFENVPIGVDILSTYPRLFSSKIGQAGSVVNEFYSSTGVNIQSSGNIAPLIIENNKFMDGSKGVKQNGNGLLDVRKNFFVHKRSAVEVYDGGKKYNWVRENIFEDSHLGSVAVLNNTGLRYLDNCFDETGLFDIAIAQGGIFPYQGDALTAAGNCFTKGGIPEINNDAGQYLKYFIKSGTPTSSCKYPVNSTNVTLDPNSLDDNGFVCDIPIPITSDDEYFCSIDQDNSIAQLKAQRTSVLQALEGTLSDFQRKTLEGCLEYLEAIIGSKMLDPKSTDLDGGKENAISFFTSSGMDFNDQTTAYGIMVQHGELSRANTFLNSLHTQSDEQFNFIAVQNINLDYLEDPASYELTLTNRNLLYSIGTAAGSLNGYARSLYEILTGERIETEIPIDWRSASETLSGQNLTLVKVFPNPLIEDFVNVSIENLAERFPCEAILTDAFGRIHSLKKIFEDGTYQLNESKLQCGIYFISVIDNLGNRIFQSKLISLK